jgi:hypothetical protein
MPLVLEMEPETERLLRETAQRMGMETGRYALQILKQNLVSSEGWTPSLWERLTPDEWVRRAEEYLDSHGSDLPCLPDASLTREGLYGEHW